MLICVRSLVSVLITRITICMLLVSLFLPIVLQLVHFTYECATLLWFLLQITLHCHGSLQTLVISYVSQLFAFI